MFELDQAVAQWRRGMAAKGIKDALLLDEMESHLRDDIDQRLSSGATAEAAFDEAVQAFGQPEAIRAEFRKIKPAGDALARSIQFIFPAFILGMNTWTLCANEIPVVQRILGISAFTLLSLTVVCWPTLSNRLQMAGSVRTWKVIKAMIGLLWWWPLWALLEALGVVHSGLGVTGETLIWSMYEAATAVALMDFLRHHPGKNGGLGGTLVPQTPWGPVRPDAPNRHGWAKLPPQASLDLGAMESLEAARREATRWGHDYIGTEHLLLGLLHDAPEPFANLLSKIGIDPDRVKKEIDEIVSAVFLKTAAAPSRLTPRASRAIALAAREARAFQHKQLSVEHILLGLLIEGEGIGALVLRKLGVQVEATRREILRSLK